MPTLKDVLIKIGAVKKTKQITKAMGMEASWRTAKYGWIQAICRQVC